LAEAPAGSADDTETAIQLKSALETVYDGETVVINGNVAPAMAGDTVEEEVLGSGDASKPNQVFVLKKPPLSYVHAPTETGIASTLSVAVKTGPVTRLPNELGELPAGGVAPVPWRKVDSLAYQTDTDRAYVVRTDDKGRTTVTFGDGINGARLPSGEENVVARYRSGGGLASNVAAGAVRTLGGRPATVRTATNPVAATGGADPETLDTAKVMAPLSTRPLRRVVSLSDYEDFARLYPGIGRAAAKELWDGKAWLMHITIGAAGGGSVASDSDLYRELGDSIRRHRASVRKLRLDGYRLITFDVDAAVTIDKDADPQDMESALKEFLADTFSSANRRFAQNVAASEIVVALQRHPGVVAVDLKAFHLTGSGKGTRPLLRALEAHWDRERDIVVPAQVLAINALDGITLRVEPLS
jgi:predicted phage baseplate assembly protein